MDKCEVTTTEEYRTKVKDPTVKTVTEKSGKTSGVALEKKET